MLPQLVSDSLLPHLLRTRHRSARWPGPARPCASGSNAAWGDEQATRGGERVPDSYILSRVTLTQEKKWGEKLFSSRAATGSY
jgi:hypothetical protein